MNDLMTPSNVDQARCSVSETFFCGDSRYAKQKVTTSDMLRSGEILDILEYDVFSLFEQGGQEFTQVKDSDPNIIPALSMFSTYIQLPTPVTFVDHFLSLFRMFTKSEKKYRAPELKHVTCTKSAVFIVAGVLIYITTVFFIYAFVVWWQRKPKGTAV